MAKSILTQIGEAVKTKTDKVVKDAAAVSKELTATVTGFDERISTTESKLVEGSGFLNNGMITSNGACTSNASASILNIKLPKLMSKIEGTVTVNDGTSYFCGGAGGTSCTWTVPNDVSIAEFQIWGAGSNGDGYRYCCAGGLNGADGGYVYVKRKVTPGEQYVLCAGGACSTGACVGGYKCDGCASFVCKCESGNCFQARANGGGSCISCQYNFRHVFKGSNGSNAYDYGCTCCIQHNEGFSRCCGKWYVCASDDTKTIDIAGVNSRIGSSTQTCQCRSVISAVHICNDHTLYQYGSITCSSYGAGCCYYATDRGPGKGGWGSQNGGCCCTDHGSRGNTGQVIVRYK